MAERSGVIEIREIRDPRSIGDIVRDVVRDLQEIVRSELRLARTEMTDKARSAGKAGGLLGAAAISGFLAAAALTTTIIVALNLVLPLWLAALITTCLLAIAAGALFSSGRTKLRQVNPVPRETVQTLQEDAQWARQRVR